MLLALANASHAVNLGQEDACFNRCEQAHGMSAQLAYAKACWFFINKHSDEGLRYFSDMQSQHANGDIEWKTDWARYLDLVNDPRAKDEWISLGDNHSDNVKIQWLALGARTAQVDRPFISRTIERLRTLRGDKGTFLSIIRAKYILQGDPSEKDAAEAVLLLTDVNRQNPRLPFAHILLANAYQRQKNINGAIDELSLAADLVPDSSQVALDVARLLNHQRDFTRARPYIDRVARGNTATSDERRAAGTLLAEAADIPAAIQQFEQIPAAQLTTSDKLSLASFYRYQNIPAKVEPLLEELLKTPTADSVQLAAEYYTSQNRPKDAEHALLLLDTVNCPVTVKSRIRAAYFARNSTPEKTIQEFLTATKTSPTDPAAWNQLLAFCLYLGRMDDVARFAPDAHAAIPSDPALTILSANLPLIRDLGSDAAIRPLFIAIIQAPANAADIVEALQLVASTRSHKITSDQMLVQLRQIAGRCPSVLALQMLAARVCLANGRADDAVDIASHALQAFPGAPDAAQITAESLAAAGRWNEVVTIGKQWRDRILASPLPADIVIANAYMQLGNMDAGLQQLQPHLNRALKAPEENPNIILLYVQGLVNSNKTEQASQLLQPLLTLPSWRREYVFVAARLPNEKDSAAWLARVSGAIPPEASDEKLQLAMGYQELASRTQNVEYRKTAVAIIEPIAARPDCNPQTLAVLGSFYESQGNLAGAEQIYRRSLQGKPDQPIILNNLAMVIVHKNGDPNEAFEYVSRAISLSPTVPNFFDTQATILAAQKSYDKAIVSIGEAIKLAPKDPQWQAARIWLLSLSGQQKTAASEYQQLQSTQNLAKLPEEARQRLNTVGFQ
jgi:tetratricopeptide (TPR) repeat protein